MPVTTSNIQNPGATDGRQGERRSRTRLKLRWKVYFFSSEGLSTEATTLDISSDGFLCVSNVAFSPGQAALCRLEIPRCDPARPSTFLSLDCRIKIVRVVPNASGLFAVGCRIEDYCLM